MSNVKTALNIVESTFAGKKDLAGQPYILHLKRVAEIAKQHSLGVNHNIEEIEIVALLHDLLEEFPDKWSINQIDSIFRKAGIVDALQRLTRKKEEPYKEYIIRTRGNILSRVVKISDLKDNMDITRLKESLTEKDLERLKKYHDAYNYLIK